MSIYEDFPNFAHVPHNWPNRTEWLFEVCKKLSLKIHGLEAQLAEFGAKAPEADQGEPLADSVKVLDLNQYPVMKVAGRLSKLKEHFATLGGEPPYEDCLAFLGFFMKGPQTNATFANHWKCDQKAAVAWTYILKKRGWIKWNENPNGLVLTLDAPIKAYTDSIAETQRTVAEG